MKLAFHIWRCPEFVAYSRGLEGVLAHNSMDDRIGKDKLDLAWIAS